MFGHFTTLCVEVFTTVAQISILDFCGGLATSLISSGSFIIFPFEINQLERISNAWMSLMSKEPSLTYPQIMECKHWVTSNHYDMAEYNLEIHFKCRQCFDWFGN